MGDEIVQASFQDDIDNINRIPAVPKILQVVLRTTGMGFAAVARVTEDRWIACSVLDQIDFGLKPGGELKVETTICNEIRHAGQPVLINHVAEEVVWSNHATPALYGFQSYISVPIMLADGSFFGTLCAIDPRPARMSADTVEMFRLFTELIATQIDANRKLVQTEAALIEEREVGDLREQFIAVLAHDLRAPVRAISLFSQALQETPPGDRAREVVRHIRNSASRMSALIDNLLDLARGRNARLVLDRNADETLEPTLRAVIAELAASHPNRAIETFFDLTGPVDCDRSRIAQLFANLLSNALTYGSKDEPIRVRASSNKELELSVANAGEAIPDEALQRLFQPFYRNASMQHRQGLGLGLYISHEIAKAHGGTLTVESTPEQTRFTFRMPCA